MTPLAAVAAGALAGAVGTACMDTIRYVLYRRDGGRDSPLAWEFPRVDSWEKAPDPGLVAKREIEGFTQRELPDRWAGPISTFAHWAYGSAWGAAYGVVAGSLRQQHPVYGLPFGAVVWASGYVFLPEAGLYKPIWDYDAKTLARDLAAHLGYGAGTGTAFWLHVRSLLTSSPGYAGPNPKVSTGGGWFVGFLPVAIAHPERIPMIRIANARFWVHD